MKHKVSGRKLGRTKSHRKMLIRNMLESLYKYEKIRTTVEKAKELRSIAEKLITRARINSLHNKRMVMRYIKDGSIVAKLFDNIAPRYKERPGGYTRILRLGKRKGDNAEIALIELVEEFGGSKENVRGAEKSKESKEK